MKVTIDIECTPVEARTFMGLPDVTSLNDHIVEEMRKRVSDNMTALQPEELVKNWFAMGGQAQEQFMKLMSTAASAKKF